MTKEKISYSLQELYNRKIEIILQAGKHLGYDFTKKNLDKKEIKKQVAKACKLAKKWAEQEKWVCIKPCEAIKYKVKTVKTKVKT